MRITTPLAIILDTTPLGLLTQKKGVTEAEVCRAWAADMNEAGCLFFVPEIADYELRREFLRQGNAGAVSRLDRFGGAVTGAFLPLTTPDIRFAAQLWAQARRTGHVTAPPEALDADVLIAAQARRLTPADYGLAVCDCGDRERSALRRHGAR